jgi:hypothetical protein
VTRDTACTIGIVACPPLQVIMLRFGASRCSCRFTGGQTSGPAAGVRSIAWMPASAYVPAVLAAEDVVAPFIPRLPWMDRSSIVQGYAGVYSSFLLHAQRAAERYGVPAHEILQRVGEAGYVGGQEDMIIDVALQLQRDRDMATGARP